MRMPFMLVFHQSKCITGIKRILFYCCQIYILELVHVFVCSLSLRCMLKTLRVAYGSEDVIHNKHIFQTNRSNNNVAKVVRLQVDSYCKWISISYTWYEVRIAHARYLERRSTKLLFSDSIFDKVFHLLIFFLIAQFEVLLKKNEKEINCSYMKDLSVFTNVKRTSTFQRRFPNCSPATTSALFPLGVARKTQTFCELSWLHFQTCSDYKFS